MHTTVQTCAPLCVQICTAMAPSRRHRCRSAAGMHSCVHNSTHSVHRVGCNGSLGLRMCTHMCRLVHNCADLCTALQTCAQLCAQLCTPRTMGRRPRIEGAAGGYAHSCADLCTAVWTCAQLCGLVHSCADLCTALQTCAMHSCVHNSAQFVQRVDGRWPGELWRCTQLCRLVHSCADLCTAVCTSLHN